MGRKKKIQNVNVPLTSEQAWEFLQGSVIHARVLSQCANKTFFRIHLKGAICSGEYDFTANVKVQLRDAPLLGAGKIIAVEPTKEYGMAIWRRDATLDK